MRRLIEKLVQEAKYSRDKQVRDIGISFYNAIVKWGKKPASHYIWMDKPIDVSRFWNHPVAQDVEMVVRMVGQKTPSFPGSKRNFDSRAGAAVDALGDTFYFFVSDSKKPLADVISRKHVVHEMAHYLDKGVTHQMKSKLSGDEEYFNRPTEVNAYWQAGADEIEDWFEKHERGDMWLSQKRVFGDGSWKQFREKAIIFWRPQFVSSLTQKNERKFYKRLYQLWQVLNERGVLGDDKVSVSKKAS